MHVHFFSLKQRRKHTYMDNSRGVLVRQRPPLTLGFLIPLMGIAVLTLTIVFLVRAQQTLIDRSKKKKTTWVCESPGHCIASTDPNGADSPEACNYTCPKRPYYDCQIKRTGTSTLPVRTGSCEPTNHVTWFSTPDVCKAEANCDAPQYFYCDPKLGCEVADAPVVPGGYANAQPSRGTPGSDQCLAQCVMRHECNPTTGQCTDLGFSGDTTKPVGTCATTQCPNPQKFWACNGFSCVPSSTGPYAQLSDCLKACCQARGGTTCGNTCCKPGMVCCGGKTCYDPNACETCNATTGVVSSTCPKCGICQNGKCAGPFCSTANCQTCTCTGPNNTEPCSCQSFCKNGWTCCPPNPACPVKTAFCAPDAASCSQCPKAT